jgi:hypothetical protein
MRYVADSPEELSDELSEEGARRLILLAVGALVVFVLCAGVALAISRADSESGDDDDSGLVSANQALIGTGTGPLAGADVATYSEGRRRALAEATGRWSAVVSLRDYVTEADFQRLYGTMNIQAMLVATAGGEPEVVEGSLGRWATQARSAAEEERKQLDSMLKTTDDKGFQDQFKDDIARLDKLLAALDPAKPVVFGFVVSASSDELRALGAKAEVRLVDLIGRRAPSTMTRLRGLRPEETVKAADPRTRPV